MKAAKRGSGGKNDLAFMTSEPTFISSLQQGGDGKGLSSYTSDPSHLEPLRSEDWEKGKGAHTIKHRSKRSQRPLPPTAHTQKEAEF